MKLGKLTSLNSKYRRKKKSRNDSTQSRTPILNRKQAWERRARLRGARPYLLLALLALLRALLAGGVGGGGGGGRLLLEQAGGINAPGRDSIVLVRDHGRA